MHEQRHGLNRKTPCAILSLGQAGARRKKAAKKKPHPPANAVSSSAKIIFSYLNRAAAGCSKLFPIARPRISNSKLDKSYCSILSHHLFSLKDRFAPQPNLRCEFFLFPFPHQPSFGIAGRLPHICDQEIAALHHISACTGDGRPFEMGNPLCTKK